MLNRNSLAKEKRFLVAMLLVVSLLAAFVLPASAQEIVPPSSEVTGLVDNPHMPVSSDGLVGDALVDALTVDAFAPSEQPSFEGEKTEGDAKLVDEEVLALDYGPWTESVIGADGRTRVSTTTSYPWRAIAHLVVTWRNGTSGGCTGWFIGPRTVATAGHCVYNSSRGGWASSIRAYPGRNGSSTPYGYGTSYRLFSVTGWTSSGNHEYDYGAIQLNSTLGNTVGWFGFRWQSSNTFSGAYRVTGYPGDKTYGTMWTMEENPGIRAVTTRKLWYNIDTAGGQSGAPVYHNYSSTCTACGVAIHAYGTGTSPYTQYNSGTRITQEVYNNLTAWKNRAYP
jgi:glutamyl endopeptidase